MLAARHLLPLPFPFPHVACFMRRRWEFDSTAGTTTPSTAAGHSIGAPVANPFAGASSVRPAGQPGPHPRAPLPASTTPLTPMRTVLQPVTRTPATPLDDLSPVAPAGGGGGGVTQPPARAKRSVRAAPPNPVIPAYVSRFGCCFLRALSSLVSAFFTRPWWLSVVPLLSRPARREPAPGPVAVPVAVTPLPSNVPPADLPPAVAAGAAGDPERICFVCGQHVPEDANMSVHVNLCLDGTG